MSRIGGSMAVATNLAPAMRIEIVDEEGEMDETAD
jgi:hypothetical protein